MMIGILYMSRKCRRGVPKVEHLMDHWFWIVHWLEGFQSHHPEWRCWQSPAVQQMLMVDNYEGIMYQLQIPWGHVALFECLYIFFSCGPVLVTYCTAFWSQDMTEVGCIKGWWRRVTHCVAVVVSDADVERWLGRWGHLPRCSPHVVHALPAAPVRSLQLHFGGDSTTSCFLHESAIEFSATWHIK